MGFLNNLSNKFTDKLSDYLVNYLILNKQANSKTYIQESISEKEYQTLCKIVYRCMPSEMEQAILLDVLVEMPNGHKFILKLKAKLDNYTIDKENNIVTVNDVKTIGKIVSEMQGNIDRYHYNREFAVYAYLLCRCAEKFYNMKSPMVKGNSLVVSTIPQYYTKVLPMTKGMFMEGWKEFEYLLKLVARYVATEYTTFGLY